MDDKAKLKTLMEEDVPQDDADDIIEGADDDAFARLAESAPDMENMFRSANDVETGM